MVLYCFIVSYFMNLSLEMDPIVSFFMQRALLEDEEEEILRSELIRRDTVRRKLVEPLIYKYEMREYANFVPSHQIDSEEWINKFCAQEFYSHFRMDTQCFTALVKFVTDDGRLDHGYRGGFEPVRIEKKVQIAVWCLAHEESMLKIGERFGVTKSTVYSILKEFCKVIDTQFIQWPEDGENCEEITFKFKEMNGLPGVIGVIDCTHIPVRLSKGRQENYLERTLPSSIVLQGVCTAEKLFTTVSVGQHGGSYDTKILADSWLHKTVLMEGADKLFYQKYHLVGDSGYPCKDWLMIPFKDNGTLTLNQKKFNLKLNQTHTVVKDAFRLLRGRWRRLQNLNVGSISNAAKITITCCALHNFCLINNALEMEDDLNSVDSTNEHDFLSVSEFSGDTQGFTKRRTLLASL